TEVNKIFAFDCTSNHYSGYHDITTGFTLVHSDSMKNGPQEDVLAIFQEIITGTGCTVPAEAFIEATARQAAGSGSCGIAAHNFVETNIDENIDAWTNSTSYIFRCRAMRNLVVFHLVAILQGFDSVIFCIYWLDSPMDEVSTAPDGPFGYNDFNLHSP
ncbi:hypothetical protein C8J57DRAFT_1010527, partial [Mycena rebaudengoi]